MARLIYTAITSLDGYIEDEQGRFDWSAPDEEVHAFVNDLERSIGTYLCGRRLYDVMAVWDDPATVAGQPQAMRDFADIWQAADKVVFSRTLAILSAARTRLEPDFDPHAVERMKATAERDISVGGPELATQAFAAGLVDDCHLFLNPISVGGGKPALPRHARVMLELLDQHVFDNGVVHLHYRVA